MSKTTIFSLILNILLLLAIIGVLYLSMDQNQSLKDEASELRNKNKTLVEAYTEMKEDRDYLRDLWEEQTARNDELVMAQAGLEDSIRAYTKEVRDILIISENEIRLIDGTRPKEFLDIEKEFDLARDTLKEALEANIQTKERVKEEVDTMYLESGEDQPNRAGSGE